MGLNQRIRKDRLEIDRLGRKRALRRISGAELQELAMRQRRLKKDLERRALQRSYAANEGRKP